MCILRVLKIREETDIDNMQDNENKNPREEIEISPNTQKKNLQ